MTAAAYSPTLASRATRVAARLSFVDAADPITAAAQAFLRRDLRRVQRAPTRYDWRVLPYEPVNVWHTLAGDGMHVFDRTALPGLHRRLLGSTLLSDFAQALVAGEPASTALWQPLLGEALAARWVDAGLLRQVEHGWQSVVRMVPCDRRLFVVDGSDQSLPGMVWMGRDTMLLYDALRRHLAGRRFHLGLEVGCGSGMLTIALSDSCERAIGIDINPRAVECGRLNAAINSVGNVEFRYSDLFEAVPETFDLIISNPPYVFVTPEERKVNLHAHGGEDYGVDIELAIIEGLDRKLGDRGLALLLCTSPVVNGVDILPDRIRQRFADRPLQFDFQPLFNNVTGEHLRFHREVGIQYNWAYIVTVRRGAVFDLCVRPAGAWVRTKSWMFRTLVNWTA